MKTSFNINLSHVLWFLLILGMTAAQVQDALSSFGRGVKKEIAAVKQPIDETIAFVGSTSCSHVKKLIGVDYKQLDGAKEPDLSHLTLNFRSRQLNASFNLTSAAWLLSETRGYDPHANLIIFLHGFTDDPNLFNFKYISDAFLKNGEYNILGLDASSLIRYFYLRSTTCVRFIGERLGEILTAMVHKGLEPRAIHLIGHSLGSHIASFTGKQFTSLTGSKVGRISGLDPAGPCFSHVDPELRLKASDADFVDVIHTDDGVFGLNERVGHVDFYPNGGSQQPNCLSQTCSHNRVNELYAESINNPDAFLARACKDYDAFRDNKCDDDVSVMGYNASPGTQGAYYLRTGGNPTYGLGSVGASWENNEGIIRTGIGNIGTSFGNIGTSVGNIGTGLGNAGKALSRWTV